MTCKLPVYREINPNLEDTCILVNMVICNIKVIGFSLWNGTNHFRLKVSCDSHNYVLPLPIRLPILSHSPFPIRLPIFSHYPYPIRLPILSHSPLPILSHYPLPIRLPMLSHCPLPISWLDCQYSHILYSN